MKLFNKNKYSHKELHPGLVKQLTYLNNKLKIFASWLQQKTGKFSANKLKAILLIFSALIYAQCILTIYKSFKESSSVIFITPIRSAPLLKKEISSPAISTRDFERIHRFKKYLDSLQTTSEGKEKFDSIVSSMPYLTDTIKYLENIYYEQQSNRK